MILLFFSHFQNRLFFFFFFPINFKTVLEVWAWLHLYKSVSGYVSLTDVLASPVILMIAHNTSSDVKHTQKQMTVVFTQALQLNTVSSFFFYKKKKANFCKSLFLSLSVVKIKKMKKKKMDETCDKSLARFFPCIAFFFSILHLLKTKSAYCGCY